VTTKDSKGAEFAFSRNGNSLVERASVASADASNGILFSAEVIPTEAAKRDL
jgi:hypothetical protein